MCCRKMAICILEEKTENICDKFNPFHMKQERCRTSLLTRFIFLGANVCLALEVISHYKIFKTVRASLLVDRRV